MLNDNSAIPWCHIKISETDCTSIFLMISIISLLRRYAMCFQREPPAIDEIYPNFG